MAGSLTITQNMLNNLDYDEMPTNTNSTLLYATDKITTPTVLVVFSQSDINAALYHLTVSMTNPFKSDAIATVLIEETIKDDFLEKLQNQLQPLNASSKMLFELFENSFSINTKQIKTDGIIRLICNLTHEHLNEGSGIVTMHYFRTLKECISLIEKESVAFTNATIWHENHAFAYELIGVLKCKNNYINCHNVKLPPAIQSKLLSSLKTYAIIFEGYHYERLLSDDLEKNIIFPIGSIFAN